LELTLDTKKTDNKRITRAFDVDNNSTLRDLLSIIIGSGVKNSLAFLSWKKFILRYIDKDIIQRSKDITVLEKQFGAELFELVFAIHVATYQVVKRFAEIQLTPSDKNAFVDNLFEDSFHGNTDSKKLVEVLVKTLSDIQIVGHLETYEMIETVYRAIILKQLRKPLGEYYTPTNVSKIMVEGMNFSKDQIWMDNSAGLGSFLNSFLLVNGVSTINNFVSIEVNPLTNYLSKIIIVLSYPSLVHEFKDLQLYWGDTLLNEKYSFQKDEISVVGDFSQYTNKVDVVVGNPPWVAWKSITKSYQNLIGDDWRSYDIFEKKISRNNLGACNDDMSSYFVYYSVNNYLKDGGQISYLINLTLFKSDLAGKHFRKFFIEKSNTPFRVERVEDFGDIKVFPNVTNRYCVFVAKRGKETTYPIEYIKYVKDGKVINRVVTTAQPGNSQPGGALVTVDDEKFNSGNIEGICEYKGRAGVCTWLNSIYWVNAEKHGNVYEIENLFDSGKKKVRKISTEIEAENIYRLLRARNLNNFTPVIENFIVVPQEKDCLSRAIPADILSKKWPLTFSYFSNFEEELLGRSGYRKFLTKQPFYALYNIGPYTVSDIKLCWQFISKKFKVYIVNNAKDIIPDLNVMFIPLEEMAEAYYLYAILNSSQARHKIEASSNWTFPSGSIKRIKISKYNPENTLHKALSTEQEELLLSHKESSESLDKLLLGYWIK